MINEFFDKVYVLTTSRWDRCKAELDNHGIKAEKFKSVPDNDRFRSFNLSQQKIMLEAYYQGLQSVLVLEDDVVFQNMEHLPNVLDDLNRWDWDICYFGGNYQPHERVIQPSSVSKNLRRIYNAWTTHAIGYQREAIEFIHQNYKADQMYDAWLDDHVLADMYTVATVPMIAVQRPGFADLWQRNVDYTQTWERSLDFIR